MRLLKKWKYQQRAVKLLVVKVIWDKSETIFEISRVIRLITLVNLLRNPNWPSSNNMWPLIMAVLRRNAVFITLPFAAVVGFIGYNIEGLISDKYTPYSSKSQYNAEWISCHYNSILKLQNPFKTIAQTGFRPIWRIRNTLRNCSCEKMSLKGICRLP